MTCSILPNVICMCMCVCFFFVYFMIILNHKVNKNFQFNDYSKCKLIWAIIYITTNKKI